MRCSSLKKKDTIEKTKLKALLTKDAGEQRQFKINSKTYKVHPFSPSSIEREESKKLTLTWDGPLPCYQVKTITGQAGLQVVATEGITEKARGKDQVIEIMLLVDDQYWEEFQMLQKYKKVYPDVDWTDTPNWMRYKTHLWRRPIGELPQEVTSSLPLARFEYVKEVAPTRRSATRTGTPSVLSIAAFLATLLLGDIDHNSKRMCIFRKWRILDNKCWNWATSVSQND